MKKFLLTTLLVLVTVVAAFAETVSVNTNSSSKPPYTLKSGSQDIVNITTEKGTATSDISYNKTTQMVMYSGNILKFSMVGDYVLKEVVIACSSPQYAIQTTAKWDVEGGTASLSSENYTWTAPASANVSAASLTMDGTYRLKTITITYAVKAGPVDANATFEETIETTYDPENPTLKLTYTPEDLFENGATVTYDISQAEGAVDENLNILKAVDQGVVKVKWTGSSKYNDGESKDIYFTIHKAEAALGYSAETATATMGETATLPTLTNPYNLKLRYSSSKRAVADIDDNTGAVTIVAPGTATIGAFFDGNELFKAGSATYTLTVQEAGLPATPEFSFTDEGTYKIDQKLAITTATEDAEIYYSFDGDNYIKYEGEISFDKAGAYTVFAYAKNAKGQSTTAEILFTIELLKHTFIFADAEEQMVARDRYFKTPALVGAEGVNVVYDYTYNTGVLTAIPGKTNEYFITGAGDVLVTATAAADATHEAYSAETTVAIVPEKIVGEAETQIEISFTNPSEFGFPMTSDSGADAYVLNNGGNINRTISKDGVTLSFAKNSAGTNTRIVASGYLGIYRQSSSATNGNGGSVTISAKDITKIEFTVQNTKYTTYSVSTGNLSDRVDKVYTWTSNTGEAAQSVTIKNIGKENPQITSIKVYCTAVTEVAGTTATFDMAFDNKDGYELEVGDKLPKVVLPEGFAGKVNYLLGEESINNPETFVFKEEHEGHELHAYTEGDENYLPAVAYTLVTVSDYEFEGHLTIHYSTDEGMHYANCQTVTGTDGRYEFKDIEVQGYDGVDGKYYGHVFFSFYQAPAEAAALAPRREAAVADWAAFNANNIIYTPEEHLTVAGANTTLVRNRANTLGDAMPAVLRVPATNDTQKALNFTVQLDKQGTSNVTVSEGTQTGVESVGVDADGEAEYYTLQGVRVAKPAAGIYLRRQGGTVSKVLVK